MAENNNATLYAVKSILLGARIHDAAILCDRTDQSMRAALFQFCKNSNPVIFCEIEIEAAHLGYATVPAHLLRDRSLEFLGELDTKFVIGFLQENLDDMVDVSTYIKRCLRNAQAQVSIWRAREAAWEGFVKQLGCDLA